MKDIILREVRLNPHEVRLKQTSEKLENSEKPKFPFQVEGTFGGVPDMGMGFQTWGWGSWHGDGVPDMGGIPDMGVKFLTWGGVSDMEGWGSWHGGVGLGYESPKWNSSLLDFLVINKFKHIFATNSSIVYVGYLASDWIFHLIELLTTQRWIVDSNLSRFFILLKFAMYVCFAFPYLPSHISSSDTL